MAAFDIGAFERDGFCIFEVLPQPEVGRYRALLDGLAAKDAPHNDPLHEPELADLCFHPTLIGAAATALRCSADDILLDNLKSYTWEAGETYRQGWHRDTLHSAEHRAWLGATFDQLIAAIEQGCWDHNNVQGHLALADDHGFRAVPGSHRRAFTVEERAAFGDLSELCPVQATIGAGRAIVVPAGHAIWYNNNLIHSGWSAYARGAADECFPCPRRSLLFGMHSCSRIPTWHFRGGISQRVAQLEPAVREALSPRLRENVDKRNRRMEELGGFGDDPKATIEKDIKTFWVAGLLPPFSASAARL